MAEIIQSLYSDDKFPYVLLYSTLLAILSLATVGIVSSLI
jgi:hypothetical protein